MLGESVAYRIYQCLTCPEVQSEDVLAFCLPARHLNVHLVYVLLVRQRLPVVRLAGCTKMQHLLPLLAHLLATRLQPVSRLLADDVGVQQYDRVAHGGMERRDEEDGKLEQEHDHHVGPRCLDHRTHRIAQQQQVVAQAQQERHAEPDVEEARVGRRLLLEGLHAALADPAPDLAREQGHEQDDKRPADLVAEYGHGEARFRHGKPGLVVQLFDLDCAEPAIAYSLEPVDEGRVEEDGKVHEDLCVRQTAVSISRLGERERDVCDVVSERQTMRLKLLWNRWTMAE